MANKAIVTVDVDDSAFQRFADLYDTYTKKLEADPERWEKVNDAMAGALGALGDRALTAKESLAAAAAQGVLISEALTEAMKGADALGRHTDNADKSLSKLAKTAKGLGSSIVSAGRSLLTTFGPAALASLGIGGLLGGFGIDALANVAFSRTKNAAGLGLTPGQQAAFGLYGQRVFGSPNSVLSGVAGAQANPQALSRFLTLGITNTSGPASSLAFQALAAAVKSTKGVPTQLWEALPQVQAFEALGGQLEDVRRAAKLGAPALERLAAAAKADEHQLDINGERWSDLKVKLDHAGLSIQTALINALEPLAPQIGRLSDQVAGFITTFLNSKEFGVVVGEVESGLRALADFVQHTDWGAVRDDVKQFAGEFDALVKKLGWLVPSDHNTSEADFRNRDFPGGPPGKPGSLTTPASRAYDAWWQGVLKWMVSPNPNAPGAKAILNGIKAVEGGNYAAVNKYGYMGAYQFGASTLNPILKDIDPALYNKLGPAQQGGKGAMSQYFLNHPELQDRAAVANIARAVKAGATSVAEVGAYWLGGAGGLADFKVGKYDSDQFGTTTQDYARRMGVVAGASVPHATPALPANGSGMSAIMRALKSRNAILKPVQVSIVNSTGARVFTSVNAAAGGSLT